MERKIKSKLYRVTYPLGRVSLLYDIPNEAIATLIRFGCVVSLVDLIYEGDERCVKVQENN